MNWAHRSVALGVLAITVVFLPVLHCRRQETHKFEAQSPFLALGQRNPVEAPAATDPKAWQAVPLAGRLVGLVPKSFDRWRWASADDLTLIVLSNAGRPAGVIYSEAINSKSQESLDLDRFLRTVAPTLASRAFPRFASYPPRLAVGLAKETGLSSVAAAELIARLQTRTLGRGLGFEGRSIDFTGWRWGGANAQGIELRLGRLEGIWGPQPELEPAFSGTLEGLADISRQVARLGQSGFTPPTNDLPLRPASLVVATAQRRQGFGVYLAILLAADQEPGLSQDLGGFLDSIRSPKSGELRALSDSRRPAELESLACSLGWQLQIEPNRVTDEDLDDLNTYLNTLLAAEGEESEGI